MHDFVDDCRIQQRELTLTTDAGKVEHHGQQNSD